MYLAGDGHIREDVYRYKLFNKDEGDIRDSPFRQGIKRPGLDLYASGFIFVRQGLYFKVNPFFHTFPLSLKIIPEKNV